jgi:geranylgeranyl diphosphate synthase type II
VHDDLPCFDDADVRRGGPSTHRAFGEPLAVLAGDALIVLAFETVARAAVAAPERGAALVAALARAAGTPHGLVAGQAWEGEAAVELEAYHRAKTCSLFVAATTAGAIAAGRDPAPWRAMGERLGAAYQVADDLLDALGGADEAGKPTRQDAALARPSAVRALGVEGAVARLRELVAGAADAVPACPGAPALRALALQMAERLVPAGLKQTAA